MRKTIIVLGVGAVLIFGQPLPCYPQQKSQSIGDAHGREFLYPYSELKAGQRGSYVFVRRTKLMRRIIPKGTRVMAQVMKDSNGGLALFTVAPLVTSSGTVPKGAKIPFY